MKKELMNNADIPPLIDYNDDIMNIAVGYYDTIKEYEHILLPNPIIETKESLRTIDVVKSRQLLNDYDVNSKILSHMRKYKTENEHYLSEINVLTTRECQEIIKNATGCGFCTLINNDNTIRDAQRVCIKDSKLAILLRKRLKTILNKIDIRPFGIDVDSKGKWKPVEINECFRISKYSAPSIGFKEHYDIQYCKDINKRSILSLIIYLNDDFKGGNTCFFDVKNKKQISGLNVSEEIKIHGGLDKYTVYKIIPTTGKCIMFEQNLLHKSDEIISSTKYVLRTDIVFQLLDDFSLIMGFPKQYEKCNLYFKEARNRELKNDIISAGDLYERSQTICMYSNIQNIKYNIDIWIIIINFLLPNDVFILKRICRFHNIMTQNKQLTYLKHFKHNTTITPPFFPKLLKTRGSEHVFTLNDKDFFFKNKLSCLKVITMYAVYLASHNSTTDSYIAHYDSTTQTILACNINYLLICAFYNFKCFGSFYRLDEDVKAQRFIYEGKLGKKRVKADDKYLFNYNVDKQLLKKSNNAKLDDMLEDKQKYNTSLTQLEKPGYSVFNRERKYTDNTGIGVSNTNVYLNNLIFDFSKHKIDIIQCNNDYNNCTFCKKQIKKRHINKEGFIANISNLDIESFNHAAHYDYPPVHRSTTSYKMKYKYTRLIDDVHIIIDIRPTHIKIIAKHHSVTVF